MWVVVSMDFSRTGKGRTAQNLFCRQLQQDGFSPLNRNTWVRYCTTAVNAVTHTNQVKGWLPDNCCVTIMRISDSHGDEEYIFNHYGRRSRRKKSLNLPDKPKMIEFF